MISNYQVDYFYEDLFFFTCTPMFTAALFTIARKWKQPRCPLTNEWIKTWYIYTIAY